MADGVLHRQQTAPRMSEQRRRFEPEALTDAIEIVGLGRHRDVFGLLPRERSAAATLVVVHEMERFGQPIHLGQQVLVVEVGAAVQNHDRDAVADVADVQARCTGSHEALAAASPGARSGSSTAVILALALGASFVKW